MNRYTGMLFNAGSRTVSTEHYNPNAATIASTITISSDKVFVQIDGEPLPFVLNSVSASKLMLAQGDALEIAGEPRADRIEIYGLRNLTDGSVYLAETLAVARSVGVHAVAAMMGSAVAFTVGAMIWKGVQDVQAYLSVGAMGVGLLGLWYGICAVSSRMGWADGVWSFHGQAGGRSHRTQAAELLGIDIRQGVVTV